MLFQAASDGTNRLKQLGYCSFLARYPPFASPPCAPRFLQTRPYSTSNAKGSDTDFKLVLYPSFNSARDWGLRFSRASSMTEVMQILKEAKSPTNNQDPQTFADILGRAALLTREFALNREEAASTLMLIEADLLSLIQGEVRHFIQRVPSIGSMCTVLDTVRRYLDSHSHFGSSPSSSLVGQASLYVQQVQKFMYDTENPSLAIISAMSSFTASSLIKSALSAPSLYDSKDLELFQAVVKSSVLASSPRELWGSIASLLLPPQPLQVHYQYVSNVCLESVIAHHVSRTYSNPGGLFLLASSFVEKNNPVLLKKHETLLDMASRICFVWRPYILLLLLAMRGQGLPLPSSLVSQAANVVREQPNSFRSIIIKGFQHGVALDRYAKLKAYLWSQGIEGLQVMMTSQANHPDDDPYSQEHLSIILQWAQSGLEQHQKEGSLVNAAISKGVIINIIKKRKRIKAMDRERKADAEKRPEKQANEAKTVKKTLKMAAKDDLKNVEQILTTEAKTKDEETGKSSIELHRAQGQGAKIGERTPHFIYLSTGEYLGQKRSAELLYSYVRGGGKHPWILNLLCDHIYPYN